MKKIFFLLITASIMMISCQSTQEVVSSDVYVSQPVVEEGAAEVSAIDEQAISSRNQPNSQYLISSMELSDEQVGTYKSILEKYNQQMAIIRKKYEGNEKAAMDRIRQLQVSQDAEIRSILDESQYEVYVGAMEAHRSK